MRRHRSGRARAIACVLAAICVSAAAWSGLHNDPAGVKMVRAASAFLRELTPSQRQKAVFRFDDPERLNWHYIPRARRGLSLKEMTDEQREAAHALLHAGLSRSGFQKATTIMALEAVLHELERGGRIVRDPDLYYWSIFGSPSMQGRWGWRVEGHHLSLNYVIDDGRIVSATPAFFGANPATVKMQTATGIRVGTRVLAREELLARKLLQSLDDQQRSLAVFSRRPPRDIRAANTPQPPVSKPIGIPGAKLNASQRQALWDLLEAYAAKMPEQVSAAWLAEIRDSGLDRVYFAWAGGAEEGQPHYYRVQGPDFLIEYANVQSDPVGNPANHIHSVWRSLHGDFGLRLGAQQAR